MEEDNTGGRNSGNWNSGDFNTGDRNTGERNTGDFNTGQRNTGSWNTGDFNSGNLNIGDRNAGDWNSGDWNTGSWNTGFFNTVTPETIMAFNKEVDKKLWDEAVKPTFIFFNLIVLIPEIEMSDQETIDHEQFYVTGGYLKKLDYKEAFQASWSEADQADRDLVRGLPNFDADVFFEISGIRVDDVKKGE